MKKLRIIRRVLAATFLVCAVLCFVLGEKETPTALDATRRLQFAPMYLAESAGVIIVWLLITLVWGRIYCSTACPMGALQDVMLHVRRCIPALNKPFRYTRPQQARLHVLIVYAICLITGLSVIPLILEPWFMTGNMTQALGGKGTHLWVECGYSALWGVIWGIVSLIILLPWALLRGREFCNTVCPLGTAMGYLSLRSTFQIVIDSDKCVSCMRCQDNCRASCIKVVSRYVDNSRCVRCLECVVKCPQGAIRYTPVRTRPVTPLFTRTRRQCR